MRLNKESKIIGAILIFGLVSVVIGYNFFVPKTTTVTLMGAGATFPYPLISKWAQEFHKIYSNITINYQPIGSGGGIRAIVDQTVDFGASDAPLNRDEFENASAKGTILHIPETIGAVVIAYNIPGLNSQLKLTGEIIVDIYLGKISKWNDLKIAELNPDVNLPDEEIIVVKRSDSSGTTYIFTDYLSSISEEWRSTIGKTKIFNFVEDIGDRGLAVKGNQGVTGAIKQNPYSVGYIELAYAIQSNIPVALIKNHDGYFVKPNITTISAAAAGFAANLPKPWESWENVSIVNAPGKLAYPLSSFSYLLVYAEQKNYLKFIALKKWLLWIITEGQEYADDLLYAPLPAEVVELNMQAIERLKYTGESSYAMVILILELIASSNNCSIVKKFV